MKLNDFFDKIYVINLDRRLDRWESVSKQLKDLNVEFTRVSAVDGKALEIPGWQACTMSHRKVLQEAQDIGLNNVLIFEDDVVFTKDFSERLSKAIAELPEDWDIFYLGASFHKTTVQISSQLSRADETYCNHAIGINKSTIDLLLKKVSENDVIDKVIASLQSQIKAYAITPSICVQYANHSDIQEKYVDYSWLF
jgi:GR25 family glycosyltransferase involved in LPS biosynthesis